MGKVKIVMVDDHSMVREGFKLALAPYENYEIVGEAENGKEGIEIVRKLKPDIVVMDIGMPVMNGIDASAAIRTFNEKVKILILTMMSDEEFIFKSLSAGIDGYIYKMAKMSVFRDAIESLVKGESYFAKEVTDIIINRKFKKSSEIQKVNLTKREVEIVELIVDGFISQEIADKLFISYYTVAKHRKNIGDKLNLKNTAELIKYAINNNIV